MDDGGLSWLFGNRPIYTVVRDRIRGRIPLSRRQYPSSMGLTQIRSSAASGCSGVGGKRHDMVGE